MKWDITSLKVKENGIEEIFGDYFDNFIYLDDSCFMDNWHYKWQYLKENDNIKKLRELTLFNNQENNSIN